MSTAPTVCCPVSGTGVTEREQAKSCKTSFRARTDPRATYWVGSVGAGGSGKRRECCVRPEPVPKSPLGGKTLKGGLPCLGCGISWAGGMSKAVWVSRESWPLPDLESPSPHCRLLSEWAAHWPPAQEPWPA